MPIDTLSITDLGRLDYASAWDIQKRTHAAVLAGDAPDTILLVEHDPVITLGKNPKAAAHITASADVLEKQGVTVVQSDRGGDVTYHGPGQLVAYPIIRLNDHGLNIRAYVRLLEDAIIATCRDFGIHAHRDVCAVGVWVGGLDPDAAGIEIGSRNSAQSQAAHNRDAPASPTACGLAPPKTGRKIAAIGVRVRRWVTLHGLALNVAPDLSHFNLIVPCGLVGRPVTAMAAELSAPPALADVRPMLTDHLTRLIHDS